MATPFTRFLAATVIIQILCTFGLNDRTRSPIPPSNMSPDDIPQFLTITFDDALQTNSFALTNTIMSHVNRNGEQIPVVHYISNEFSDYALIQQRYLQGSEIAVHTVTHSTGVDTDIIKWYHELTKSRQLISTHADIPLTRMTGFRAPFLEQSDITYKVLNGLNQPSFGYDSSVDVTLTLNEFDWPYTYDQYDPDISYFTGEGPSQSYPGTWEMPMYALYKDFSTLDRFGPMDYSGNSTLLFNAFKANFLHRNSTNKAPMGLYFHPGWLATQSNADVLNDFIAWVLAIDDTWIVTNQDVIDYINNPVPKAQYSRTYSAPLINGKTNFITCQYSQVFTTVLDVCPLTNPHSISYDPTQIISSDITITSAAENIQTVATDLCANDAYTDYDPSAEYCSPHAATVRYNDALYTCQWWTQGNIPGEGGVWVLQKECGSIEETFIQAVIEPYGTVLTFLDNVLDIDISLLPFYDVDTITVTVNDTVHNLSIFEDYQINRDYPVFNLSIHFTEILSLQYEIEFTFVDISPTFSPTNAPSNAPSMAPTETPTANTNAPTAAPTLAPTAAPTLAPTLAPTKAPTDAPTIDPTTAPTLAPSTAPSKTPTQPPSTAPTQPPSIAPSNAPSTAPTNVPTESPSTAPTAIPTVATDVPTNDPTMEPTVVPSNDPTMEPTVEPTTTPTAPSQNPTTTPTMYPSKYPTVSPSKYPTVNPTDAPTSDPTAVPTFVPSAMPTSDPTNIPTFVPSNNPTSVPSDIPTTNPTTLPTSDPTNIPSGTPTLFPSVTPTQYPSNRPTFAPTSQPTAAPTLVPSANPSSDPTNVPTVTPSVSPSDAPTQRPSDSPIIPGSPTKAPTPSPSRSPTQTPSNNPSAMPTETPTMNPSVTPTDTPTMNPSRYPTQFPSKNPSTVTPSNMPSQIPSQYPTKSITDTQEPTTNPSVYPTNVPTETPSTNPSAKPTVNPTVNPTESPLTNPSNSPTTDPTQKPTEILGTLLNESEDESNSNSMGQNGMVYSLIGVIIIVLLIAAGVVIYLILRKKQRAKLVKKLGIDTVSSPQSVVTNSAQSPVSPTPFSVYSPVITTPMAETNVPIHTLGYDDTQKTISI